MFKNYIILALRNIKRNKLRTVIHLMGLAIGLSICFLIFNVVWHANSFDKFHPEPDRIFRINTLTSYEGGEQYPNFGTPGPLGEVIDEEISGIEKKARLYTLWGALVVDPTNGKVFGRSNEITFSDRGFFEIFPRKWLSGNPSTALENPSSAVISQASMEKYFPGSDPQEVLGKELMWIDTDTILAQVTGVVEDFSQNTDFIFKDFISYSTIKHIQKENWYGIDSWGNVNSSSQLFVKSQPGKTPEQFAAEFETLVSKYYPKVSDNTTSFSAEPLEEFHFNQNYNNTTVSKVYLKGLIFIAGLILLLACLNFINLETAQAIGRAKEVGIRKTLGGNRGQLIAQFLTETYMIVLIASLLAMFLVEIISKMFLDYLPDGFEIQILTWPNIMFVFGIGLVLTIVSGLYPGFILANYQPQRALKGETLTPRGFSVGVFLRKNLTVLQFTASIAFIILVSVLGAQMKYISSQPLGFKHEAVLYSNLPFMAGEDKMNLLRDRFAQQSFVSGVSLSGSLVSSTSLWTSDVKIPKDTSQLEFFTQVMNVDSAFISVNGVPLIAGKRPSNQADEIVVNKRFLKEAGMETPDEILGLIATFGGEPRKIVGVMDDFHSRSFREEIRPLLFTYNPTYFQTVNVKVHTDQNLSLVKSNLEEIYRSIYPYETEEFHFLEAEMEKFYRDDLKIQRILSFSSALAVLISMLGLFGLSSFTIAQKLKEISIRKVLGASVSQILRMISQEYVILVAVSFVLACIPAYYFGREWLNDFQYRIEMPYGQFVIAGGLVLVICLLVVGLHSYSAATTNPAKILKDE
jgi:ABC-type antimicrobial peptide transport system permease subunit